MAADQSSSMRRIRRAPASVTKGSTAGFAEFYEREVDRQTRRAMLLLGSREAAQDAVHDSFVEVLRRWDELTDAGPYLERVVLNRCRDLSRRDAVARRYALAQLDGVAAMDVSLFDALAALPFNHRAAVVLRYYHQFTEAEIAAALTCRPGSVGPWIHRGLRRLEKELS